VVTTETKQMSLRFSVELSETQDINPHFVKGKMRIAYHGENQNKSNISKEVFEEAIPTMFNCPIVARYDRDTDQFGSHDIEVVIKDHSIKLVNATTPLGIVPDGATWGWEKVMEGDIEREYLTTDVLLWKRQESVEHLMQIGKVDQSMECDFIQYHTDEKGILVAEKICFSAFCLLESAEPCFADASVEVFTEFARNDFKRSFMEMLGELKEVVSTAYVGATFDKESHEKGGNGNLEEETMQEVEQTQIPEQTPEQEPAQEQPQEKEYHLKDFAATYGEKRHALENLFGYEELEDAAGNVIREVYAWVEDFDDTYVYVHRDIWEPETDSKCDVGRFAYSYDETTMTATLTGAWEEMVIKWLTIPEYQQLESQRQAYDALVQFKADTLKAQRDVLVDEIIDQFADLEANKDFQELKEHVDSFDNLEDFSLRCFAIRGKVNAPAPKKPTDGMKVPIGKIPAETAPYGGIFELYGHNK